MIREVGIPFARGPRCVQHTRAYPELWRDVTDPKRNAALEWAIGAVQGQLNPAALTRDELRQFTGTYGPHAITLVDDWLEHHFGGTTCRMIPMGEDTFLLEGIYFERLRFSRDRTGEVVSVVTLTLEGPGRAYGKND